MDAIARLSQALIQEKGFKPTDQLPLPEVKALALDGFDFFGIREYWGSVASLALMRADNCGEERIGQIAERFFRITQSLSQLAGTLWISTAFKTTGVKLGSSGILGFVYENGCSDALLNFVRKQKRGNFSNKQYALFWVIDVPTGRVHTHRWLPFGVFPRGKYLQEVLERPAGSGLDAAAA